MNDEHHLLDRTIQSAYELYWRHKLRRASSGTINQFNVSIANFKSFLGRDATIDDLTDKTIADAMHWFIDRGRAEATANKFRSNMLAIWRFLARKRIVDQWPDVEKFVEPERIPTAWSQTELHRLWDACSKQTGRICGVLAADWWLQLHAILWDTGERIGAVLQVMWDDIDLERGHVVFRAETRKNKKRDRLHKLHPSTIAMLAGRGGRAYGQLVFPWDRSYHEIWHHYKLLLISADLPSGRASKFHRMRKSTASHFEAAGGNASLLLDHASPDTTRRHYLDPRIVTQSEATDVLFRPGGPDRAA